LAQSRLSSNSYDWRDVAAILGAFEGMNECRIMVELTAVNHHGQPDILMSFEARETVERDGDLLLLASVSLRCSDTNRRSLDAAVSQGLYALDAKLASGEFEKVSGS